MNDIIITRREIKDIAERIYSDVDSYDYQDNGYMLKDLEIEVANWLSKAVCKLLDSFEFYSFGPYPTPLTILFAPSRYCDANGCESPVRADDDIWCHWHGEIEDKRQAEAEALACQQFDDLDF